MQTEERRLTTLKELEFVIFCIENLAEKSNRSAKEIYRLCRSTDVIHDYLLPLYPALHTQSKTYILEDLEDILRLRGVEL